MSAPKKFSDFRGSQILEVFEFSNSGYRILNLYWLYIYKLMLLILFISFTYNALSSSAVKMGYGWLICLINILKHNSLPENIYYIYSSLSLEQITMKWKWKQYNINEIVKVIKYLTLNLKAESLCILKVPMLTATNVWFIWKLYLRSLFYIWPISLENSDEIPSRNETHN